MGRKEEAEKYLNQLKSRVGDEVYDKLIAYVDMVLERNSQINLTAIKDRDEAIIKHLADSLTLMELPELWEAKEIIDVGTGAGFPGALLAIACPEKEFVLLDSTLKRLKVIDEFAQKLEITNIRTIHARAEEAGKQELCGAFDLCVSRAVADLQKLAAWCLPFVRKGGAFVAYKGENYESELNAAKAAISKAGGTFDRAAAAGEDLEDISGHRLLVIKKTR